MSELKPCKCKICKCDLEPASHFGANSWQHWDSGECVMDNTLIITPTELAQWNALNNDTPAILRGARIGLEMAAKAITKEQDRLLTDDDYLMDTKDCCAVMQEITDADIMKEISRDR